MQTKIRSACSLLLNHSARSSLKNHKNIGSKAYGAQWKSTTIRWHANLSATGTLITGRWVSTPDGADAKESMEVAAVFSYNPTKKAYVKQYQSSTGVQMNGSVKAMDNKRILWERSGDTPAGELFELCLFDFSEKDTFRHVILKRTLNGVSQLKEENETIILKRVNSKRDQRRFRSTRKDFDEYCKANLGRWIGDIIWVTDWPLGAKKGDKLTGYREFKPVADGNGMTYRWHEGPGAGTGMFVYDPVAGQIQFQGATSGGTVWSGVVYKEAGKWRWKMHGRFPDGKQVRGGITWIFSQDGKTHRPTGTLIVDGKKADPLRDVWRRVSE